MLETKTTVLALGLLALGVGASGCAGDPGEVETRAGSGKADNLERGALPDVLVINEVSRIPAAQDPSTPTFEKSCLHFDNPAFDEADDEGIDNLVTTETLIVHRSLGEQRSDLSVAQLRETLRYHIMDEDLLLDIMSFSTDEPVEGIEAFETLEFDDLNSMAEGARFGWVYDKVGKKSYDLVNIGLGGGNSFELVFEHGTLKPVAVTQDGSLTHCDEELLRDPS